MNPDTTNQPSQPAGMPGSTAPLSPMPEKKGAAGVIMLVIIVLVLLAGGYFLMQKMNEDSMVAPDIASTVQNTAETGAPATSDQVAVDPNTIQGSGTSLTEIEADLNATDLDSLSADLNAI